MRLSFDQAVIGVLIFAILMGAALTGLSIRSIEKLIDTGDWVDHTQEVVGRLDTLLIHVQQVSLGFRGYALTHDSRYLDPVEKARRGLLAELQDLETLTRDNPARRRDLPVLGGALSEYLAVVEESERQLTNSPDLISGGFQRLTVHEKLLQDIFSQMGAIEANERQLLSQRNGQVRKNSRLTKLAIETGSLFSLLIVLGAGFFLYREMQARYGLQEALRQEAEHLQVANRELESFSYSVSHDLRAPLRHIHGFIELLQKKPVFESDPASKRQMGMIAASAKQMGMLIDDLLSFSRVGRSPMCFLSLEMRPLVDEAIGALEPETRGRRVLWEVRSLPWVQGDLAMLRLVWSNLLSNAVKYTRPREEVVIEIGQLPEVPGKPREAVCYVRDNGVGFDMQYVDKLFGVFQRLHRAEDFEGTGIGLANVQRIIHRHGGRIWAESRLEQGTIFYFSLPTLTRRNDHA